MTEVTRELCYVYIAPKYFYRATKSFTKVLHYIHLTLATIQSVVAAATNNLAQFDCLRSGISTKSINKDLALTNEIIVKCSWSESCACLLKIIN